MEGRELTKLTNRAAEFGISPAVFAKKLVSDNLERKTDEELTEQFELLQSKIEASNERVLSYIKEVFYVLSDIPREELDKILAPDTLTSPTDN